MDSLHKSIANDQQETWEKWNSSLVFITAGGISLVVMHLIIRFAIPEYRWLLSDIISGMGFVLALVGSYCIEKKNTPKWLRNVLEFSGVYLGITRNQFIALFFAILLSITATISAGYQAYLFSPVISLFSWAGSIMLVVYAGWEKKRQPFRLQNNELQLVIILFLMALALRGIETTNYPNALGGDEASAGLYSLNFINDSTNNIFNVGWYAFPSLFSLIQSIGIRLFGQTIPALRIPSAFVGSITVVAFYFVVRVMFNSRAAFISSLLLVFSHYHIHFSRIGLNNIWDGLSWVVTLGVMWLAWKRERKAAFILAGLSLGFSQYFYTSSRGLFVIVPVWLFLVARQDQEKFRRMRPNIFLLTLSMIVIVLPLAWYFLNFPDDFQAPMNRVTIMGDWLIDYAIFTGKTIPEILLNQFTSSFLGLTSKPLKLWYDPGYGLLRPISAAIFYFSSVLMLLKIKDNRTWLIILWLGSIIFAAALSTPVPAAQRYVAAIPVCLMIIGFGIDQIIIFLERHLPEYRKIIFTCMMALIIFVAVDDTWFYFRNYSPRNSFGGTNTQTAQRLANMLDHYDSSWIVVFSGQPKMEFKSIASIRFLAPHIKGIDFINPWDDPKNVVPNHKRVLFVFLPINEADLQKCMQDFPGGVLSTEYNHSVLLFYLYIVQNP